MSEIIIATASRTADDLPQIELIRLANDISLIQLFAERKCRRITVDYVPARERLAFARPVGQEDDPLIAYPPEVIPVTYTLEDAMFGGVTFAAITCGFRLIVNPFVWTTYEEFGSYVITVPDAE